MSNKKKIPISQLRPGMFIDELDISWLKSPFLRHRRKIESEQDIRLYQEHGVKMVTIDIGKGFDVVTKQEAQDPQKKAIPSKETHTSTKTDEKPSAVLSFSEELKAAKAIKNKIQGLTKQLNQEIKEGRPVNIQAVKPVIEETLESLKRNDQALLTLLHMHRKDVRLNSHPFGVFSLVLPLALKCQLNGEQTEILGMAALLHDCGWARLPLNLFGKGKAYTPSEIKLIQQHTVLAAHTLRKSQGIPEDVVTLVEQHHELPNGKGYPKKLKAQQLHPLLPYLQLADHYDEYIHGLTDRPAVLPVNALKLLYKENKMGYFPEQLVTDLVRILGIYPLSSIVRLNSDEIAIVAEVNRKHPLQPKVSIFRNANGEECSTQLIDLQTDTHQRKITEVMETSQLHGDPPALINF